MTVPAVIPIAHVPGYRTDTIGRFGGGQFLAGGTYAYRQGYDHTWGSPEDHHLLFAVLHTFDHDGHHLDSDIWRAGTWREQIRLWDSDPENAPLTRTDARLTRLLDALPERRYTNIAIRPFEVVFDGVLFGLVVEQHDENETEDDWAELYPDQLGFHEPWNGSYDT